MCQVYISSYFLIFTILEEEFIKSQPVKIQIRLLCTDKHFSFLSATSFLLQVEFKDTNFDAFLKVLEYLYTGQCPFLTMDDIIGVLALANFFCLPRLVALCEKLIVKELQVAMAADEMAVTEDIIGMDVHFLLYMFPSCVICLP